MICMLQTKVLSIVWKIHINVHPQKIQTKLMPSLCQITVLKTCLGIIKLGFASWQQLYFIPTKRYIYQLPMIWSVWTLCQQKVRRHWQNHFLEHATDVQTRVQHGIAYPIPRPTKRQSSTLARFYDFSAFFHKLSLKVKLDVKIFFLIKNLGISVRWRCNPYNILIFFSQNAGVRTICLSRH